MGTTARLVARALLGFTVLALTPRAVLADPKIEHTPPKAAAGANLTIKATITASGKVLEAVVGYRAGSEGEFKTVPLKPTAHKEFVGIIPGADLTGDSLEYYLSASDGADMSEGWWHSKVKPQKLKLAASGTIVKEASDSGKKDSEKSSSRKEKESAPPPTEALEYEEPKQPLVRAYPPIQAEPPPTPTWQRAVVQKIDPPAATFMPSGTGYLKIVSFPTGATIIFDGTEIGTAPLFDTYADGKYLVQAKLDGYSPTSTVVKVTAGAAKVLEIALKPK